MTAKPWPHEWREGMRLLPVPDMEPEPQPALLIANIGDDGWLHCVNKNCRPWGVDPSDPRIQPDLDDDGTVGHLKGMVREAIKASGRQGADLMAADYVLEPMDCVPKGGGKSTPGWYDPVTVKPYPTEGEAYVAALDHLAAKARLNEVEGIPLPILLQSSIPMAPSLTKPATFHGGGLVGSVEVEVVLAPAEPADDTETVASLMADHVRERAPGGWTVEHLDADSCPSQGWGGAPSGISWYFRNRHGRWTFAVGHPNDENKPYVPIDGAVWKAEGEGNMLDPGAIVTIVLDCMREFCLAYNFSTKPSGGVGVRVQAHPNEPPPKPIGPMVAGSAGTGS